MAAKRARHRGTAAARTPPSLPPEGTVVDLRVVRRVERDSSQAELGIGFTLVEAERIEDLRRSFSAEQLRRRRANA